MLEKKVTGITQCGREITVQEIEEIKETVRLCRQIAFIPAPPFRKVITIAPVTSCGKALTPSLTTP